MIFFISTELSVVPFVTLGKFHFFEKLNHQIYWYLDPYFFTSFQKCYIRGIMVIIFHLFTLRQVIAAFSYIIQCSQSFQKISEQVELFLFLSIKKVSKYSQKYRFHTLLVFLYHYERIFMSICEKWMTNIKNFNLIYLYELVCVIQHHSIEYRWFLMQVFRL